MNKKLKQIMTRVAKGEISELEAQDIIKDEKVAQNQPVGQIEEEESKNDAHKRKKSIKSKGG